MTLPDQSERDVIAKYLDTTILVTGDCTVDVFVATDGNPGHFVNDMGTPDPEDDAFTLWEPTGCFAFMDGNGDLITDVDGDPVVDTISLNDGVKLYEADANSGKRLSGPASSLQLVPIGCDSDGDGIIDELDASPVDPQ